MAASETVPGIRMDAAAAGLRERPRIVIWGVEPLGVPALGEMVGSERYQRVWHLKIFVCIKKRLLYI